MNEITNTETVIDSRDVIKRIEYLQDNLEEAPEELEGLLELAEQGELYASDWRYGATIINEDYFEDYAKELAEDCGMINNQAEWPNNCLDWEKAAEMLKQDYTEIDFCGNAFYIR
jgi:uncharacterized protein YfcZ (UPF0381/DUF406 family)